MKKRYPAAKEAVRTFTVTVKRFVRRFMRYPAPVAFKTLKSVWLDMGRIANRRVYSYARNTVTMMDKSLGTKVHF